jgi:hypothetical protein
MAIGQITKFPINTIFEFATSAQFGLCPQLCSYIHEFTADCDFNKPVSEHGISLITSELSGYDVYFKNVGRGLGKVWSHEVGNLNFHNTFVEGPGTVVGTTPISFDTSLQIVLNSNNTIVLNGIKSIGSNINTGINSFLDNVSSESVQGGKYQYVNVISGSMLDPVSGAIITSTLTDDVIGKIVIKTLSGFEPGPTETVCGECINLDDGIPSGWAALSIGTMQDKDCYVKRFLTPIEDNTLLKNDVLRYNYKLTKKEYDWISPSDEKDIRIFYEGAPLSGGVLKINIFYDKVKWVPEYGYIYKTVRNSIDTMTRINFYNETSSVRRDSLTFNQSHFDVTANKEWVYIAGGKTTSTFEDSILKADSKNDTVKEISRGTLTVKKHSICGAKSNIRNYYMGGASALTGYMTDIDSINIDNDTNAVLNTHLTVGRMQAGGAQNSTNIYIGGGEISSGTNTTSIEKMTIATDTVANAGNISTSLKWVRNFNLSTEAYFINGCDSTPASVLMTDKYNYSTELITAGVNPIIKITAGSAVNNNLKGYLMSGTDGELNFSNNWINTVQSLEFSTSTWKVVPNITILMGDAGDAASV